MSEQRIPLDATDTSRFTPAALEHLDPKPVFIFQPPTRRDREQIDYMINLEGLARYSEADLRAEALRALKQLQPAEQYEQQEVRLRAFWAATDDHNSEFGSLPFDQRPPFEHPDADEANMLFDDVLREWAPLRRMAADKAQFEQLWPPIVTAHALKSVEGLDVTLPKHMGRLTLDAMYVLGEALEKLVGQFPARLAMSQLNNHAISRTYMLAGTEKNSASPPASVATQTASPTDSDDGKSPVSESSTSTPEPSPTPASSN